MLGRQDVGREAHPPPEGGLLKVPRPASLHCALKVGRPSLKAGHGYLSASTVGIFEEGNSADSL